MPLPTPGISVSFFAGSFSMADNCSGYPSIAAAAVR